MREKAEIVLRALLMKREVEFEGHAYRLFQMGDDIDADGEPHEFIGKPALLVKAPVFKGGSPVCGQNPDGYRWMNSEMMLGEFLSLCEAMPQAQVDLLAAGNALQSFAQEKGKRRRVKGGLGEDNAGLDAL